MLTLGRSELVEKTTSGSDRVGLLAPAGHECMYAEELRVPVEKIKMVMGDTQLTPYDRGTFGSRTTPEMNLQLRKAASAARETLIGLAAAQWQIDRKRLLAGVGKISDAG